ncbi:hypothetical protein EH31_06960 [Erythrobacter longus]|uniref:Uncharacterized protein n=2 Tax=Erythrobacter longus TaxID=1044 RepID=A0A074M7P0_ERYLO|nr:hypothetical protein EH31_06960 [Erythrobacter longus]
MAAIANANELISFVKNIKSGIGFLKRPSGRLPDASKSELGDFLRTVQPVAHDSNGTLSLAVYENDDCRVAFQFDTREARDVEANILAQTAEMNQTEDADHKRVLMVFTRTNVSHAQTGKRSGELVEIETLNSRPLPIVYASRLAEERIRHEIADGDDNVYKKAFDVDVNVEMRAGKPIAYRLVAVHDVIDLPDEE